MRVVIVADNSSFDKQIENGLTYLESTYKLFSQLSNAVFVQCPESIAAKVAEFVPKKFVWTEPESRGTAPALAFAALQIKDDNELTLFAFANQTVRYQHKLLNTLKVAEDLYAQLRGIILIGVAITTKTNQYGYIKVGKVLREMSGVLAFEMKSFNRHVSDEEVKKIIGQWNYLWDTGYILSTAHDLLDLYRKAQPEMYEGLLAIKAAIGTKFHKNVADTIYKSFLKTTVSEGVIENVAPTSFAVIPVDLGVSTLFEKENSS